MSTTSLPGAPLAQLRYTTNDKEDTLSAKTGIDISGEGLFKKIFSQFEEVETPLPGKWLFQFYLWKPPDKYLIAVSQTRARNPEIKGFWKLEFLEPDQVKKKGAQ